MPVILDEYGAQDDRIRAFHHKNKGVGGARNDSLDKDCIECKKIKSTCHGMNIFWLGERAFEYILSITKTGVAEEEYGTYTNELRGMLIRLNFNKHLERNYKLAIDFACIFSGAFKIIRKLRR